VNSNEQKKKNTNCQSPSHVSLQVWSEPRPNAGAWYIRYVRRLQNNPPPASEDPGLVVAHEPPLTQPPSSAVGLSFLRCGGASPPAATRIRKTHVTHLRTKIERVYRPYLTAAEAAPRAGCEPTVALTAPVILYCEPWPMRLEEGQPEVDRVGKGGTEKGEPTRSLCFQH
jgi:hypothetical protein